MKITLSRVDKNLPLPVYETQGSVGFDLLCRTDVLVNAKYLGLIPANIIVQTPPGYMLCVVSRSSTPRKKNLLIPHGIGVIDTDYCGFHDEIFIQVYNFSHEVVLVKRGEKIAQGIFVSVGKFDFQEEETMNPLDRGGFGSTDKK